MGKIVAVSGVEPDPQAMWVLWGIVIGATVTIFIGTIRGRSRARR